MIIKCPKCENVFLAPDDLEENQLLKCGNCEYSWSLSNSDKEIPNNIKPTETNHSSDFNHSDPKESSWVMAIIITAIILCGLYWGAAKYTSEIVNKIPASVKLSEMINLHSSTDTSGLMLNDIVAIEADGIIYLAGEIVNTSPYDIEAPQITVADLVIAKTDEDILPANSRTIFEAILPQSVGTPIKVSF